MASKGRKDKGNTAPVVEEPPEKEVVPGKITESQWLELLRGEESAVVAGEVIDGLVDLAFTVWQDHYLEEQAFPHTIQTAKTSLLQIIEWQFLQRDEGEREPENDPTWLEDDEPVQSVIDSWARGIVPQSSEVTEDTPHSNDHLHVVTSTADHEKLCTVSPHSEREVSTANSLPPRASSRRPTHASTVDSSSTYTTASRPSVVRGTAKKAAHPRPQARRPRVRLEALTQPHPDTTAITDSQQETENDQQAPSPAHSHTPTLSPLPPSFSSHPLPLPYNMKPAQLRWQKEVTYDSSGNIVDMVRLDPSHFPSHRVRPRVCVSDPTSPHSCKRSHSLHHHASPLSCTHTLKPYVKSEGVRSEDVRRESVKRDGVKAKKGAGLTRRRGEAGRVTAEIHGGTKEGAHRFPTVLTLPPLVDTIDVSAGVRVREGDRSIQGPPSPRRHPHFLLPHTTMRPVHPQSVSTVKSNTAVLTTGDAG